MSRFTMALAAAAAAAIAAIAVVALPAIGDDSNGADPGFDGFVACLRTHGLPGAPGDPAALKPWLATKEASDPRAVMAAMEACNAASPPKREGATGPEVKAVIDCVRKHGFDAPTDPLAFKRWLAAQETAHPAGLDAALADCKITLDPGKKPGAGKPPADCGAPADKPAPSATPAPDDAAPDSST